MTARILIANPLDAVREMLAEILRYHDYDVAVAKDKLEAVTHCKENAVDLMVLAVGVPGLDGVALAEELDRTVPFLIHSNLPETSPEVNVLYALGAVGQLVNGPKLHHVVACALERTTCSANGNTLNALDE